VKQPTSVIAELAGICPRWLRRQCKDGTVQAEFDGYTYLIDDTLCDRLRLRYFRMRRLQADSPMGVVRDGVAYHHDGSTHGAKG
jgi:hypothetical protein